MLLDISSLHCDWSDVEVLITAAPSCTSHGPTRLTDMLSDLKEYASV